MSNWLSLSIWLIITFGAAATGRANQPGSWYLELRKPAWNPPGWLFAPVWTLLYTMMALAAWRVFSHAPLAESWPALLIYLVKLAANATWSWLFFGRRRIGLALLDLILLWLLILACLFLFRAIDPLAGALLAPYLAWVSFAGVLNYTIWRMNRENQGSRATTL